MTVVEAAESTAELPADLIINLELLLAYSPTLGRLWRANASGTPIREFTLWHWDHVKGRPRVNSIKLCQKSKVATHVIYYMLSGRWPKPDHVIDHIDGNPSNNVFTNLRECTVQQNMFNADRSSTRWNGRDQVLEQGVTLTPQGRYRVEVLKVQGGTYKSRVEANEVCRKLRRQLKADYDIPTISWRRHHGPSTRC
jgi:hypothetical protein